MCVSWIIVNSTIGEASFTCFINNNLSSSPYKIELEGNEGLLST